MNCPYCNSNSDSCLRSDHYFQAFVFIDIYMPNNAGTLFFNYNVPNKNWEMSNSPKLTTGCVIFRTIDILDRKTIDNLIILNKLLK
jgi:hypothetical protein